MRFVFVIASAALLPAMRAGDIAINEIHLEPDENTLHHEFIELTNAGAGTVDISGWFFSNGIRFTIPANTRVPPGGFVLVAEDPAALASGLGASGALGPYEGSLSNDGESIVLRNGAGEIEDEVDYGVAFPWPTASAGKGSSMELIHPSLDNDLGGSWRASGYVDGVTRPRITHIDSQATGWRYRKGTSEPAAAWRTKGFVEDASWLDGQTGIGYGDGDDITLLGDMQNSYSSVYLRRTFTIEAPIPPLLKISLYMDDGAIAWINDFEVARIRVAAGNPPAYNALATQAVEPGWQEVLIPNPDRFLVEGENIIAVHALNAALNSSDFSIDLRLFTPGSDDLGDSLAPPTPGRANSVLSENAPPQVRQVRHLIAQPTDEQYNIITAKVTDPDEVASVELHLQFVEPGAYIPAFLPVPLASLLSDAGQSRPANPVFEDEGSWTTATMLDDGNGADELAGDAVYTAVVSAWANRTIVRYRVTATDALGASVRVPYADDPSLNFAYFVYNGVPDYEAAVSITGKPTIYPAADLSTVAVYFLVTRQEDLEDCIAPDTARQIPQGLAARMVENWEGTFVYDGVVYDHINYRLRGANGRYQIPLSNPSDVTGKRHWHFRFNKGNGMRARDRWGNLYPNRWKVLLTGRMFGNRLDGNWGLPEQVNDLIWNAYGVPSPRDHVFHWRVITGPEEAPLGTNGQYLGDFWGIAWATENYDNDFLEARGMPKGNLYKLINQTNDALEQQHYQAPYAVSDGSDHNNIEYNLRPTQSDAWLTAYVDYDEWYRYHAVVQAIRHYDYWADANKNAAWYFVPDYAAENSFYGRMQTFPFDADATWGPTWNNGIDRPFDAIYGGAGKPDFQKAYRNAIREVRDLLWQRDGLEPLLRHVAAFYVLLEKPDTDRWRNAPAAAGRQYFSGAGEATLAGKINDMLKFAFTGGSWAGGDVGAGGRASFLDSLGDSPDAGRLPAKPTVTYAGPDGYPIEALRFQASAFSDPQGAATFGAMKWRIAEVTKVTNPASIPLTDPSWTAEPFRLEIEPTWESEEIPSFQDEVLIPIGVVRPGGTYRARVRMRDSTNLWSHWSSPAEFVAGAPGTSVPQLGDLRVTEVMYHPGADEDLEFVELENIGSTTLDLTDVRFSDGIDFAFGDGAVLTLPPGGIVVIVSNLDVFTRRYSTAGMRIAGQFSGKLDNGGERLLLTLGRGLEILDFGFDDGWYDETDGGGRSLTIRDVRAAKGTWNDPRSWFASSVDGGTPGIADPSGPLPGGIRPGDVNLDGSVDLADPLSLLFRLFAGSGEPLPCAGASLFTGGNLKLLDGNGNSAIDLGDAVVLLTYLFQGGPAHILGEACVAIEGCPQTCTIE